MFLSRNPNASTAPFVLLTTPPSSSSTRLDKTALPALLGTVVHEACGFLPSQPRVILAALARPPAAYKRVLPKAKLLDCFASQPTFSTVAEAISGELCNARAGDSPPAAVIVVDSLAPLIYSKTGSRAHKTQESLLQWLTVSLNHWRCSPKSVVAVVATVPEGSPDCERLASTVARASAAIEEDKLSVHVKSCRIRRSGCVVWSYGSGVVDETGSLSLKVCESEHRDRTGGESSSTSENAREKSALEKRLEGLSFRVGVSAEERKHRDRILPDYVHQNESVADAGLELHPPTLQVVSESGAGLPTSQPELDFDSDEMEEFEESEDV